LTWLEIMFRNFPSYYWEALPCKPTLVIMPHNSLLIRHTTLDPRARVVRV
jgi:hypothetical protein